MKLDSEPCQVTVTAPRLERRRVRSLAAFTLIELLVVIAVIAILAALVFPVLGAAKKNGIRSRSRAQLTQIAVAIEGYKGAQGFYPPDFPPARVILPFPLINTLYYELLGTTLLNNVNPPTYRTLDGSAQISAAELNSYFGGRIGGINNSTKGGDEGTPARNLLKGLKANQFMNLGNGTNLVMLGTDADGPQMFVGANGRKLNPWRYVSTNPTNNPHTYDLWIDVNVGSKVERICNWSDKPLTLP